MSRLLPLVLVPALAFAGPGPARAELVTITLGGATFSALSDTVTLTPRTFTADLAPGVPLATLLQSGEFTVSESFTDGTFPGTLSRPVSAGGGTGTLSQPLSLSITPTIDTLTILPGPTTLLNLGVLRRLEISPVEGTTLSRTTFGTSPFNLRGTFRLIVVPEPCALVLPGVGLLGLLGYRWRRKS